MWFNTELQITKPRARNQWDILNNSSLKVIVSFLQSFWSPNRLSDGARLDLKQDGMVLLQIPEVGHHGSKYMVRRALASW